MDESAIPRIIRLAGLKSELESDPNIMFQEVSAYGVLDKEVRSAEDVQLPFFKPYGAFMYALAIGICDSQDGNDVLDRMDEIINEFWKGHPSLNGKDYSHAQQVACEFRDLVEWLHTPKNRQIVRGPF